MGGSAQHHVLYIEDNVGDVELMRAAFRALGGDVELHAVENGVQAYEYLGRRGRYSDVPRPDLVLLDLNLPIISGYEILREIGRDPTWRGIPTVVLSSSDRAQDVRETYANGAFLYIVKPALWDRYVHLAQGLARLLKPKRETVGA